MCTVCVHFSYDRRYLNYVYRGIANRLCFIIRVTVFPLKMDIMPAIGVSSIAISMSVCLFTCLSLCPLAFLNNHMSKFHEFLYKLSTAVARSSLTTVPYVMYFRFCVSTMGPTDQIKDDAYVSSSSPDGSAGDKVAVYNYICL